jgi:outer membrane protein OmpA-like peptidoglycan-associated protein
MLRLSISKALCATVLLGTGCFFAVPASAQQEMYPGEDVIVNPIPGSGVLLYPGGKYGRVQRQLLQPGAPFPGENEPPIHLHMPYKHVAHHVKKTPAAPPTAVASVAPAAPTTNVAPPTSAAPATDDEAPPDTAANIPTFQTTPPPQSAPQKPAPQQPVAQKPAAPQPAPQKPAPQQAVAQKPAPQQALAAAQNPTPAKPAIAKPAAAKPPVATQIEQYAASLPAIAQAPKPAMPSGFKPVVAQTAKPAAFVPTPAPAQNPRPAMAQAAKPAAAPATKPAANTSAGVPFSLTPEPTTAPPAPAPQPTRVASNQPPPAHTPPATPLAADLGANGLVRQSQILFGPGAPDPVPEAIDAIKGLAGPLNSALAAGATKVQVVAYGGAKNDKSSDARRLSLKRALIIRQLLIDGGVPSGRIDVHAMGGTSDNEPTDRVDIFTKA